MIPLPPLDPKLSELAIALDGDAVAELILAHLPGCAGGRFDVESCRPHYVRYKPGTNCVVQYALGLRGEAGATVELPAHVNLYADDRALRRWRKPKLQDLVAAADHLHPRPFGGAAYLPEVRGLVSLFPVDYSLPAVVDAAGSDAFRDAMRKAVPAGIGPVADTPPTLVRYKPARKALLRFGVEGAPDSIYAKALSDDRGERVMAAGHALLACGIPTATPLACLPDERIIVHAAAPGVPLLALEVEGAGLQRWMGPTASVLATLHAAPLCDYLPEHRLADEASAMRDLARTLGILVPALGSRLDRLAAALAGALSALTEEAAPVHGDFYTDQVLVSESGVTLIDLDEMRRGHPLLDVGMFLAHLTASGRGDPNHGEARAAFQEAYARLRPASPRDVAVFEATALLRKAPGPFRRLEPDWPDGIERLVALAERCLERSRAGDRMPVPTLPHAVDALLDPALPQLGNLMDPRVMVSEFRRAFALEPVTAPTIDIVRHKPGRRCLLRYDLEVGGTRRRLYGKTFASQRGPRVHDITRIIAEARAFGPDVLLPEPVAFLPHLKLLLQREAPGEPIAPRLLAGDTMLGRRMAEAMHALHRSSVDLGRRHTLDNELDPLPDRVEQIAESTPVLAAAARHCLEQAEACRPRDAEWRWCPCHRDCYHDQFLIGPAGLAVLDLDDAAMSEPALDIANVLAHLRLLGLQERDDPGALDAVAATFRETSCRLDCALQPDLLRFLEGATLLRLAAIHLPKDRGPWLARRLLDEVQSMLPAI